MIEIIAFIGLLTTILILQKIHIYYFQMNRYEIKTSYKMLLSNYLIDFVIIGLIDILNYLLYINEYNTACIVIGIVAIVYKIYLFWNIKKYNYQKNKLKYTQRVLRWIGILISIYLIAILLIILLDYKYIHLSLLIFEIVNLIGITISKLIEYIYEIKYKNAAIKKLSNYPNLKVIGITGSYGKTSVKQYLYSILQNDYIVKATPMSYNTLMGVCKYINGTSLDNVNYLIVEMGAVRKGDIAKLCRLVHPDIGIITSIGNQHLDTFGSVDNIYKTKNELADYLMDNNGVVIYNINDKKCYKAWNEYNGHKIGVYVINNNSNDINYAIYCENGETNDNIYKYYKMQNNKQNLSYYDISTNKVVYLSTMLLGEHNLQNVALAVTCARLLGIDSASVVRSVASLKAVDNRLQPKIGPGGALIIMDAYNSNEFSFGAMLKVAKDIDKPIKILITPGVVDMGNEQYDINYRLAALSANIFNEIWIINKVNKYALLEGANSSNADCIIKTYDTLDKNIFSSVNELDDKFLVIFENDLPDTYK